MMRSTLIVQMICLLICVTLQAPSFSASEVRAFPGAEGFAAMATGGRGGQIIHVTNLNATGAGSLQAALNINAPRIIVFDISGVITADIIEVPHGNVTIAGQTAPGGGITIKGRLYGAYSFNVGNIIIRHLRIRPEYENTAGQQFDSIQFSRNSNVMLDHVSVAFGVDETIDMYEARNITLQWSSIEMSRTSGHPEGQHNYGFISGPNSFNVSLHHNLFVHHKNRNPAIASGPADIINNVAYNVRHGFVHHNPASGQFNIVGNYYKDGTNDNLHPFYFDDENNGSGNNAPTYYLADNFIDDPNTAGCNGLIQNPWTECDPADLYLPSSHRSNTEFDFSNSNQNYRSITRHSSLSAYAFVLAQSGAFPRDIVTQNSISQTENRTGSWGAIYPTDYMEGLSVTEKPTDTDNDGIPDAWEISHGLNPNDSTDNNTIMPSNYTAIEEYINELADNLISNKNSSFFSSLYYLLL